MAQIWPPKKNVAFDLCFPIYGNSLTAQSGAAGLDSEVSKDGAAFSDCSNEATEIGSTGIYKLSLTSTEMNADVVAVQVKTTSLGTLAFTLYTVGGVWVTAGPGALNRTIGVTVSGTPIEGASVWLTTDAAGTNVIAGSLTTSSLGIVTVLVDAGSYYVWVQKDGYNAIAGQSVSVS
jgi:hypothetical protein